MFNSQRMYHGREVVSAGDVDNGRSIAMIGDRGQTLPPTAVSRPRPNSPLHSILFVALAALLLVGLVAGCAQSSSSGSSCDVANAASDCDNDSVLNGADAFPNDACASVDSDGDMLPDSLIQPDDDADDACTTDSSLTEDVDDDGDTVADDDDAFPLDACASLDSDGDMLPDRLIQPDDDADDACTIASSLMVDTDIDGDGIANADDISPLDACASVDSDGDGCCPMIV